MASLTSVFVKSKIVFIGDQSVGKSNIVSRLTSNHFNNNYEVTVGIDFFSKSFHIENNRIVRLQMWDTSGQERHRNMIPSYIRDSSVVVIVYNVANRQSFLNTTEWIEHARTERGNNVKILLVGNKTDFVDKREVSTEEGEAKAREFGVVFMETSAKSGVNMQPLLLSIIEAVKSGV